jgi:2-polyprenyl-6-methoxyphenol hydroxylase-like FAD-dependent oxidoreductase
MKVAINGIGVAGPTLAYWLRHFGHEPVLFEKAPELRAGGYVIDFWGTGYEIAERMGIIAQLREHAYLMERMDLVDAQGHVDVSVNLSEMREVLDGRFFSIARSDLSAILFNACSGISANFGVSIVALEDGSDGITATLSNGEIEHFDLVIGADGLHSHVRKLTFGPESQFEKSLGCYVAAFRIAGYPRRDELTYVSHTVPERHVARVSLSNDETLILLVCRSDLLGNPPHEQEKLALRTAFGNMGWEVSEILDAMEAADDLYFDSVSQIHLPSWYSGRVGLVGDAAACPSLLAGEGTGLAMTEAYVLAGELHRASTDFAQGFSAYDARLRPFVTDKQKAAPGFRGFFAPETELGLKLRNLGARALSIPFAAKWLFERSVRDNFDLPDYDAA